MSDTPQAEGYDTFPFRPDNRVEVKYPNVGLPRLGLVRLGLGLSIANAPSAVTRTPFQSL
ncbi:hypothetical protein [Microvirga aerophila]|uniref:Uncharacterized protein n=1 Tax=Microvirga aerophila TaxID=670291 RepID=A0A512C3T4_9HYPH|nr:hypothetical protein [Microvirga aerophila]GEO18717.1 hypothetical protein MAE02_64130 [Microvirga aerophila]